ncbi:MAG: 16S rRNA (uracil(1498)-N(3))-methyltransferase [Pseudomonadota bacterium]
MNIILAEPGEIDTGGRLHLNGRRLSHLREVLRAVPGDRLRVGEIGGRLGAGTLLSISAEQATIEVTLDSEAPPPLPVQLVLALPRPKMLRRILRSITELGVKQIYLINSFRVEKSYWQSPLLQENALHANLREGLEQAVDTVAPELHLRNRFRPFVEDELPALCRGRDTFLADPAATCAYPSDPRGACVLIIGPEGGFIPFERELLIGAGARPVHVGRRILRVETAVQSCLGRHLPAGATRAG